MIGVNIFIGILSDAIFAAIAGVGFGAISNPPKQAFKYIAILAAVGHACRYVLMEHFDFEISSASLVGASVIGWGSLWLGRKAKSPMTVLYIPALLPMIPGKFAYHMVLSMVMYLQNLGTEQAHQYRDMVIANGVLTSTIVFFLAVGATVPMFIMPKRALSLTRQRYTK